MKKSDIFTPIGLVLGIIMISFGIISGGGASGFLFFIDIASIVIVIGGTIAGLLTSFPLNAMKSLPKVIKQAFSVDNHDLRTLIQTFVTLSEKARREGLLALEAEIENVEDKFIKKGVLLAIDGIEPDVINDIMNAEIIAMEERHSKGRNILEKGGEIAPSWGMIGTLVGLVLMLQNLDDPASLGPNMAIAILTTLYGSLLANVFFIPMANKLALKTEQEVFYKQVIIEGVIGVQSGQNPKVLEEKLSAFLSDEEQAKAGNDEVLEQEELVTNEA
ncbi:flagellar motor protein MotP [Bacillus sp. HMF5848]|uniref:flagellar motor protein MotP n=1 Tax=Bacillus sp. HMF5848 TaxID=2495421 RepID=UPI000F76E3D9|nr:flagellar motor protein MotP [Bacillus sp. HMF5848]RSK28198.1 flagellar motor protein MotP [Bacillus sp. HMF5848]